MTHDIIDIDPRILRPTQFCLGFHEVSNNKYRISRMSKTALNKWMLKKIVPVVIGPKNEMYLIDRHHWSKSVIESNIPFVKAKILQDCSHMNSKEFKAFMIKNKWVNLYDENHKKKPFESLPKTLDQLTHDYFRSLAWAIRQKKGFTKSVEFIPFFEFRWGEVCRKYITTDLIKNHFKLAVRLGMVLAKDSTIKKEFNRTFKRKQN